MCAWVAVVEPVLIAVVPAVWVAANVSLPRSVAVADDTRESDEVYVPPI